MISTSLMIRCAQQHTDMRLDYEDFKKLQKDVIDDVAEATVRQEGDIQNLGDQVRQLETHMCSRMTPATSNETFLMEEFKNADIGAIDWHFACELCSTGRFKSLLAVKQMATRCGIKYEGF